MKRKIDFATNGHDLTVHSWVWKEAHEKGGKQYAEGWKRSSCPDHYSLTNMKLAVWRELITKLGCETGETAEELLEVMKGIQTRLSLIATAMQQKGSKVTVEFKESE